MCLVSAISPRSWIGAWDTCQTTLPTVYTVMSVGPSLRKINFSSLLFSVPICCCKYKLLTWVWFETRITIWNIKKTHTHTIMRKKTHTHIEILRKKMLILVWSCCFKICCGFVFAFVINPKAPKFRVWISFISTRNPSIPLVHVTIQEWSWFFVWI